MSFDQPRHNAGTPAGGRFATTARRETGLALVPGEGLPMRDILAGELAAKGEHLAHLQATELVLREQHTAALEAARAATTARQARSAGGDVAEVDFMRDTVAMEAAVTRHDITVLQTRVAIAENPAHVFAEVSDLRRHGDLHQLEKVAPMMTALDVECDAGRLDGHPWRDPKRAELVEDLTESLEATPRHPAARTWTEHLAVLTDPIRVQRLTVAARHTGDRATLEQLAKARQAETDVTALLKGERPSTPQLRVV